MRGSRRRRRFDKLSGPFGSTSEAWYAHSACKVYNKWTTVWASPSAETGTRPTDRPTGYYSNTSHTHIYGERDKRRLLSSSVNISGPYNGPANGRSRSWCPPSTVELVLGRHGQSAPHIFIYIPAILPDHHHPSSRLHRKRKWTNSSFSQRSFVAHIDDVYVYIYIYTHAGFPSFRETKEQRE